MLISVILDDNNHITQFATGGYLEGETLHFEGELPEDFFDNFSKYQVIKKGKKYNFVLDEK